VIARLYRDRVTRRIDAPEASSRFAEILPVALISHGFLGATGAEPLPTGTFGGAHHCEAATCASRGPTP